VDAFEPTDETAVTPDDLVLFGLKRLLKPLLQEAADVGAMVDRQAIELGQHSQTVCLIDGRGRRDRDVFEDHADEELRSPVVGMRGERKERCGDGAATGGERWIDLIRLRLVVGKRQLVVPPWLLTERDRVGDHALEVLDNGMSRLKLIEEEVPIAPQ
jgi:hypothetical protein